MKNSKKKIDKIDQDTLEKFAKEKNIDKNKIEDIANSYQGKSEDELLDDAIKLVVEYQQASTSFIQRKLRVGFNRASRIMDELEAKGIISEKDGSRPRQVLIGKDDSDHQE